MQLSLKELNELIYCVGTVMSSKTNTYGAEARTALYEKLTTELESRVNDIVELERAPEQSTITKKMPKYVRCIDYYGNAEVGAIYNTSDKCEASKLFHLSWEKVLFEYKNLKGVDPSVKFPKFQACDAPEQSTITKMPKHVKCLYSNRW